MINISQMRNHHMDEINHVYAPLYLVKHGHYLMNERALISVPGGETGLNLNTMSIQIMIVRLTMSHKIFPAWPQNDLSTLGCFFI